MARVRPISMLSCPAVSGIDLYIETKDSADIVKAVDKSLQQRRPVQMTVELASMQSTVSDTAARSVLDPESFQKLFEPTYRILCYGEGANLVTFCTLAKNAGFDVIAFSPDEDALGYLAQINVCGQVDLSKYGFFLCRN